VHKGTCIKTLQGYPVSYTMVNMMADDMRRSMDDFFSYGASGASMGAAMYVGRVGAMMNAA
jgi:hypothetical protein